MIYTILTRKPFKFICTLAILILAVIILVWMVRTPTIIDMHYVSTLSKKYPIIFLIRHGERCDRSSNVCLSYPTGITEKGTYKVQEYGNVFNKIFSPYVIYATDTVRTIQTAKYFSGGEKLIIPDIYTCSDNATSKLKGYSSKNKVTVIFTHNHCLSRIAKKMNGWHLKSDYLETLVLHRENEDLILDGIMQHEQ
ncbi:TPA: lipopolysaccharide core heptose(II)-phosphate phosphatase [Escherichia coli]|nr:lipopolysaccharide core heptose(II)-phosphate phosphatase [Escherichia coli]